MIWQWWVIVAFVLWSLPLVLSALLWQRQQQQLKQQQQQLKDMLVRLHELESVVASHEQHAKQPSFTPIESAVQGAERLGDLQVAVGAPPQSDQAGADVAMASPVSVKMPPPLADPFVSPPASPPLWQQREAAKKPTKADPIRQNSTVDAAARLEPDEQSISVVTSSALSIKQWFSGGNAIVRVGMLLLLVGVVFLLRLATEHFQLPIEVRLAGVALGALAVLGVGLRLTPSRRGYGLTLQGGGLAALYLTIFAAFRLYHVLPNQLTFVLLGAMALLSAVFAVRQDALPLALLAFGGAFLAPILTSTGQGNVVALFSYYLLLNLAVAWIAHQRTWKVLNALGAVVTFGLAGLWGWQRFDPSVRWPLEGVLIAHLALYIFIVVRYSQQLIRAQESDLSQHRRVPVVDSGLLFGVPMLGFGLQAGLLHDVPYALAVSSAVLAAVYLAVGRYLLAQGRAMRLLTEGVLALGIAFSALVLPLAVDATWTSIGWSVQGAALVWLAQRQSRHWLAVFGLLLELASLLVMVWMAIHGSLTLLALAVLMLSLWLCALFVRRSAWAVRPFAFCMSVSVLSISLLASVVWLERMWASAPSWLWMQYQADSTRIMVDVALLMGIALTLAPRFAWREMQILLRVLLPLLALCTFLAAGTVAYEGQWMRLVLLAAGVTSVAVLGVVLLKQLANNGVVTRVDQAVWLLSLVVLLSIVPDEFVPWLQPLTPVLLPALLWLGMCGWMTPTAWLNTAQVRHDVGWLVMGLFGLWVLAVNTQANGQMWGLPYVPLLNPLDLTLGVVGLSVWAWLRAMPQLPKHRGLWVVLGGLAFWTLTGMIVRTLHQWVGTPLWSSGAWDNDTVQTSLTIVWTLVALLLTVQASRHAWRMVWLAGIVLLALVVLKLMLVDLSSVGAVARVVSFMGAGGLMLLIGYVAPLPPALSTVTDVEHEAQQDETHD